MADSFTTMFMIILGINVMMFLGQAALADIDPTGGTFYNCKGSLLGSVEQSGCNTAGSYLINDSNPTLMLPSGASTVSETTGNIFTDAFTGHKSWILNETPLGFIVGLFSAPYNFLKAIQVPEQIAFALGGAWWVLSIVVTVAWLFGRNT